MKIKKSIDIAAAAEKVWPFLVEPASIMKWCTNAKNVRRTGEPRSGLKTPFYFEERAVGRLMKLHVVVTEWSLNRSVAFKMTAGNFVKGYEQKYTLEPTPTGIRFTCSEDITLPFGILGKFAALFRKPVSEAYIDRMLARLKALGEGSESKARAESAI